MEDTSWISGIFANPFLRGLLVGLFIALVLWVRGLFKVRDLNGSLKKLREHLHTKLEIDSAENERRKGEMDKLRQERDNLRNMVQVLNQKPGRQELRQPACQRPCRSRPPACRSGQSPTGRASCRVARCRCRNWAAWKTP